MSVPLSNILNITGDGVYEWFCPGCKRVHRLNGKTPNGYGERWVLSGSFDAPTLTPGHRIMASTYDDWAPADEVLCNYFITAGNVEFQTDCAHELAGRTVAMPDFSRRD